MREPTNRYSLPLPIVEAVKRFAAKYSRDGADISATQLGEPPRIIALKNRHGEEIQEDVSDRLYAIDGQIVHQILEVAAQEADESDDLSKIPLIEVRFHAGFAGWNVSGQIDHFDIANGILSDYKRVSVYQRKRETKDTWVWQLNVLAELLRRNGHEVKALEAVRWYRDWSASAKMRELDYPDCAIERVPIPLWPSEKATAWIEERVKVHQAAAIAPDDDHLPECTMEERWNPGHQYAVMAKGRKTALRVLPTDYEAANWMASCPTPNLSIVERVGENRRCRSYCQVWNWCAIGRKEHEVVPSERPTVEAAV